MLTLVVLGVTVMDKAAVVGESVALRCQHVLVVQEHILDTYLAVWRNQNPSLKYCLHSYTKDTCQIIKQLLITYMDEMIATIKFS